MKRMHLVLLTCLIISLPGKSQPHSLPEEIGQYYKNKNYLSLYSLKSEREYLQILYLTGGNIDSVKDPRLKQIAYLLFSTWSNNYQTVSFNGERSNMPTELILPTVYSVDKWERDGNIITVSVKAYTVNDDLIHQLIGGWNYSCTPDTQSGNILKNQLTCMYKENQYWSYENGRWVTSTNLYKLID